MAKPTGGKNGRPRKPVNVRLISELHHESHSGYSVEALFDMYIYFEQKNAPASVLNSIQTQIENADIDTFEIQSRVQDLIDKITTTKSQNDQRSLLINAEGELQFIKKSLEFSDNKWMMISRVLIQINELIKRESFLTAKDVNHMFYDVGKIDLSESSFILDYLDSYAMKLLKNKYFSIGTKNVYIHSWLLNEPTLLGISYEVFEKVFRSATYDQFKSKGEKIKFLKTSFYQLYLDLYKKECVDSSIKRSA